MTAIPELRPYYAVEKNTINTRKVRRLKAQGRVCRNPRLNPDAYETMQVIMKATGLNRQDALSEILEAVGQGYYIDHIDRYAPPMSEATTQISMAFITAEADEVLSGLKDRLRGLRMSQIINGAFEIDEVVSKVIADNPKEPHVPFDGPAQIRYKERLKSEGFKYMAFDVCLNDRNYIKEVSEKHGLSLQDAVSKIVVETHGQFIGKEIEVPVTTRKIPHAEYNRLGYKFRRHWLNLPAVRVFEEMKVRYNMTATQTLRWAIENHSDR